jgi:hypothetical protein
MDKSSSAHLASIRLLFRFLSFLEAAAKVLGVLLGSTTAAAAGGFARDAGHWPRFLLVLLHIILVLQFSQLCTF